MLQQFHLSSLRTAADGILKNSSTIEANQLHAISNKDEDVRCRRTAEIFICSWRISHPVWTTERLADWRKPVSGGWQTEENHHHFFILNISIFLHFPHRKNHLRWFFVLVVEEHRKKPLQLKIETVNQNHFSPLIAPWVARYWRKFVTIFLQTSTLSKKTKKEP